MHSFLVWLQRNLAWSNSRQSWEERLGIFALLGGGLLIWLLGGQLSLLQQVVLWGGLILLAAVLLRRGWLKLFGPVLFYDMVRMARRNRFIWMRMAYAGLLCFFLFVTASNTYYGYGLTPVQAASRVAMNYFQTFMTVQLIVVLLITPAYVAGAVAEEKEKKTLEFLLATDLRNREIVLSKLVSRMCNLVLFILTGLPILGFMQLLGGVDPNLVLTGFLATALTMMGLAGLSIYNSTQCKRSRDAIALTYLEGFGYYAISLLAFTWQSIAASPILGWPLWFEQVPLLGWTWWTGQAVPTFSDFVSAFNSGNLILALVKVGQAAFTGTLGTTLPSLLRDYALFHAVVFTATVGWAILRLRSVAIAQMSESKRIHRALTQAELDAQAAKKGSDGYSGADLEKPPVPVRTSLFGRPPVGDLPMFWKELYAEGGIRFGIVGWLVVLLLVVLTFVPVVWIFSWFFTMGGGMRRGADLQEALNGWLRTCTCIIGSLTLLAVAIRAAGAISSEREKQTWDSLMTSPMDSDEILTAKWLGAIFSVRLSWVWLGSVWLLGIVTGAMHPLALPLVVAAWVVYSGVVSLIGLHYSMVCQTTGRATVYTMLTMLGVGVGHWLPWTCCAFSPMGWAGRGIEMLAQFQAGLTPPFVLAFLSFHGAEFRPGRPDEMTQLVLFCMVGLFIWTLSCVVLWIAISLNFRTLTHRDRLLRADVGYGPALRDSLAVPVELSPEPEDVRTEYEEEPGPRRRPPPPRRERPPLPEPEPIDEEEEPPGFLGELVASQSQARELPATERLQPREMAPPEPVPSLAGASQGRLLDRNRFVIKEHVQRFSSRKMYDIHDGDTGELLGSARQKVGMLMSLLGLVLGKHNIPVTLEVRSAGDEALVFAVRRRGLFFKKVEAVDAQGNIVGSYRAKWFSLTGGFHVYNEDGYHLANIKGSLFKSEYRFLTSDGSGELGTVSKKWGGLARELFSSADTYGVQIHGAYADNPRTKMLILCAALAIDALFEQQRSSSKAAAEAEEEKADE